MVPCMRVRRVGRFHRRSTASASAVAESEVMKLRGMVTFADTKGEMRPEGYSGVDGVGVCR